MFKRLSLKAKILSGTCLTLALRSRMNHFRRAPSTRQDPPDVGQIRRAGDPRGWHDGPRWGEASGSSP